MEVDERLSWLEKRISSSLHPRGDELRNLFTDKENRAAFLAFCNHSESRRLFVYQFPEWKGENAEGTGQIIVSATPPKNLSDKALFFLKCSHASKLNRESMVSDVVYSECSSYPLNHLEVVVKEVYLPLMSSFDHAYYGVSGDKLIDLLHRLVGSMQVTCGLSEGRVVLPLPSIEVLAEAAISSDRRGVVIHIMESSVVSWMKQVKVALHLDPSSSIMKLHGKYAGALSEYEFWTKRLSDLEYVRNQLNSMVVLNILRSLNQAHSTYSQAFIHVHRDIGKAIADTEHCLIYLNTLQPWLLKLNQAFSPISQIRLVPAIMTTLLLVWQHSGVYSASVHFHRFLHLLSNDIMQKAKNTIGEDVLEDPEQSLTNLKLALRVCAAFRGCYLDFREKSKVIIQRSRDILVIGDDGAIKERNQWSTSGPRGLGDGESGLCAWPPRNSPVFAPLNAIMERCNDLLELVQTLQDFRELVPYPEESTGSHLIANGSDPVITNIYNSFKTCMATFQNQTKDWLDLKTECMFEEHFFHFRLKIKELEKRLVPALKRAFDSAPTLLVQLRVLEMYQGISKRDDIKANLQAQLSSIISNLTSEVSLVSDMLTANVTHPPLLPLTPPTACKLLWLHALKERVNVPMEVIRRVAPELLESDEGWRLRQAYSSLINQIENLISQTQSNWIHGRIPMGLHKKLRENVLTRSPYGYLVVNLDSTLSEILLEIRHLTRPPLNLHLPTALRQLMKNIDYDELRHRQTCLQIIVQSYNELQNGLSEIDRMLLQHKLQQIEKLLQIGLEQLDWVGSAFPDFFAKANAAVCVDLQSTLNQVHCHTQSIKVITEGWSKLEGLDMFEIEREGPQDLLELEEAHNTLLELLQSTLPPSMERISQHVSHTFKCVHEASQESPAWMAYLKQIESFVLTGLKNMMLKALSTLVSRAMKYEQGGSIPPLVIVDLELQGSAVQFSPPLSTHSAIRSVPEVVQKWMSNFLDLAKLCPRFAASNGTCHEMIESDVDIKNAMTKICAHLETNSRQCQSLRKRFTIYSFLWDQDVGVTFADFLRGQAVPHPRQFSRPETVRSRVSARAHSASRPKSTSSSTLNLSTVIPPEPNLQGVMGVADWDFLRPPDTLAEDDDHNRPSLDDFDGELAVFQGILDRLGNIEKVNIVGWICVDQRPIKQALSSLLYKWKRVYAGHLEKQVGHVLSKLEAFFQETEPEVEAISGEESDTQAFMKLMSIFNRVNAQQVEMDTKFGVAHRAVVMLDKFEHPLSPDLRKRFNNAPLRWSNLKKRVALGKQRIGPRIQAKGDLISRDLSRFGEIFTSLRAQFNCSQCLRHDCERPKALEILVGFEKELKTLQTQARDLIELQELLETSVFNFSLLKEFEDKLSALRELWNMFECILNEHTSWRKHHWNEIETSELLIGAEKQMELLDSLLTKVQEDWDVYIYLTDTVGTINISVPMVDGLKSPSMRPRHWKQILQYASSPSHLLGRDGTFDPALLEELTFGQLLEMNLHNHLDEVLALVERANKDVAIESLLNTFEEVWLSRQLELKIHKRVSDSFQQEAISELGMDRLSRSSTTLKSRVPSASVTSAVRKSGGLVYPTVSATPGGAGPASQCVSLLINTGGIFETLENHQTSLQSLEGTVAAASFADELQKWHKQLQTIEAVLVVWLKVQHLWVQLEEVYCSSDIQQHLSSHTFTFSNVNREFKELMSLTSKNPAVLAICLRDGLLLSLDKLHTSLLGCQAALVQYVDGQRCKCPWFYLLPLEDILQLVCYGSSLQQLSCYMSGILRHVCSLEFDVALVSSSIDRTPLKGGEKSLSHARERSVITALVGRSGERVDLIQSVPCEGPIDGIVSQLLTSTTSTLQSHLSHALTNYATPKSPTASHHQDSLMSLSTLHSLWSSDLPTHTLILASNIILELALSKAVQEATAKGSKWPLDDLAREVHISLKALSQGKIKEERINSDTARSNNEEKQFRAESSVAFAPNGGIEPSSEQLVNEQESSQSKDLKSHVLSMVQAMRMQRIVTTIYGYKRKISELRQLMDASPGLDLITSFNWQSMLRVEWSSKKKACLVTSLDTSLSNGYSYSETSRPLLLVSQSEKTLCSLLQAVKCGTNTLMVGSTSVGKSSLVHELSMYTGQPLFSFHCSPEVTPTTVLSYVRGMAATGSCLYLHSIDRLHPNVLQATCSLLSLLQRARQKGASSLEWMGETIEISPDLIGVCFASITTPLSLIHHNVFSPVLPTTLAEAFKICSVESPARTEVLEVMFARCQFVTSLHLATSLQTICTAIEEIFKPLSGSDSSSLPSSFINLYFLEMVVSLSHKHMKEFYNIGAIPTEDEGQVEVGGGLHAPSIVHSDISENTRASFKDKYSREEYSQQSNFQKNSLEEFSLVLALKDSVLCSVSLHSREYHIIVKLICDVFPNSDLEGLLAHEANVREGMAVVARQNRNAGESARESRATSVMQMIREDFITNEAVSTVEEQIVKSCHLHQYVPTSIFQAAVAQIVTLVQVSRIVAVCGPSDCGKTAAIQVAAEAIRQSSNFSQNCCVSTTTIAMKAMREEQLFGYQDSKGLWQDGVLLRLLSSAMSSSADNSYKTVSHWFILEGIPTPNQMDVLASICQDGTLTLSNGHSISLDPSIKFILELPHSGVLTPALAGKVARIVLSQDTINWKDVVLKWLHGLRDSKSISWDMFESLFNKYIPPALDFIAPALANTTTNDVSMEPSTLDINEKLSSLEAQDLKLSEIHLINNCCSILQSIIPACSTEDPHYKDDIERIFIYAVIWSFGGFLSAKNKMLFDYWWRTTFNPNCPEYQFPKDGTLWDYHVKPGCHSFLSWSKNLPCLTLPSDKTAPIFVPSVRSVAVTHLINSLVSRDVPVLLNGLDGSGKTALLEQLLIDMGANLLHVYCNHLTSAEMIWNQMQDCLDWDWGKKYTPKDSKRLICFIDDFHNTQDSSSSELVRQHLSLGSICDPATGKWHDTSDVSYLVTTNHASPIGSLSPQFLKHFVILQWDTYSSDELVYILDSLLRTHFFPRPPSESPVTPTHHSFTPDIGYKLVEVAVQVHSKLASMFLDTPKRLHYRFTLKDLTSVFRHLCIKFESGEVKLLDFLYEWQREMWWKCAGQMSSQVDRDRYWEALSHALTKYFNQDSMLPALLHDSSARLPPDVINEMRIKLLNELSEYNTSHPILHINLYDSTIEEVCYLCHIIASPPDLGHVIMLGNAHPEPLVQLASLYCGYTLVQTTQYFSQTLFQSNSHFGMSHQNYSISQFRKDLITIYTTCGVKNNRLVLLLTDKQLVQEPFLTCIYEFVKGSAISSLFSKEEQARIVNGVRGDLTQLGLTFSKEAVWNFFLKRVRSNLRVIVSLPELKDTIKTGCYKWKGLLYSTSTFTQLPWERKRLVEVATYHLKECEFLQAGQVESQAHLLASIHLQLHTSKVAKTTNTAYQYFVERFVHELNEIHSVNKSRSSQLSLALACLHQAVDKMNSLHEKLRREEVVLKEKSNACVKLLVQISQDTAISLQHSKLVARQRERIIHLKKVIPDFEHTFNIAIQEKEATVKSSCQLVMEMDQHSLSELRSLQRPPSDIEELLVAVITIVKGTSADFSWTKGAKRLMANLDRFRELLLEFTTKETNSETLLEALDSLVMKPSFSAEEFSKHPIVGLAASQLCLWVQGIVRLHSTLQMKIRPLQLRITNMKASLSEYSEKLKKEDNKVAVLENRLEGLNAALESASVEKSKQRELLNSTKKGLNETQDFINSLSGLQEQWQDKLDSSCSTINHCVGALSLTVTLACYLTSSEPHTQMEAICTHLVPLLQERGIDLCFETSNDFVKAISALSNMAHEKSVDLLESEEFGSGEETSKDSTSILSHSYLHLCSCLLSRMIPESLVDHWLSLATTYHSLSYLLCSGLLHSSWNRWPLVYDPQNLAYQLISQITNGQVMYLDAMDRSSGFFISLEHALVHGDTVFIEHFPCPVDPAFQSLIELGHTWNSMEGITKVIHFCGHRLHVHPRFQLYLTTTVPPSSLPLSLLSDLNVINLSVTVPLAQDILLNSALQVLLPKESSGFVELYSEIAALKDRLRELEENIFKSLPKEGKMDSYWSSTDKITNIVAMKNEVSKKIQSCMEDLKHFCWIQSLLFPVAKQGAFYYNIISQIGNSTSNGCQSWGHFSMLFSEALTSYVKTHPDSPKKICGEDNAVIKEVVSGIIQQLNQTLLQDAFRNTDQHTLSMLAFSLAILSESDLTHNESTFLLVEQLIYLSQGAEGLTEPEEQPQEPHPLPNLNIPQELWEMLHRVPLSTDYYTSVIQSLEYHPQLWEKTITYVKQPLVKDFSEFPWKSQNATGSNLATVDSLATGGGLATGLDDYVMLKCLNEDMYLEKLTCLIKSMFGSISVPQLGDMLVFDPSTTHLLFYKESCPRSQALLYRLEEEVESALKGKTFISLRMGAGVEDTASKLLSLPKSDVLLVMDVQFASQEWKDMLLWRVKQANKAGCMVICTASIQSTLPSNFVTACITAHLSRLATRTTCKLPLEVWMVDNYSNEPSSFNHLLQFNLANLPENVLSKVQSLSKSLHSVFFNLVVTHTTVALQLSTGNKLVSIHFTNLLSCIAKLISLADCNLNKSIILQSLAILVMDIYSGCISQEKLCCIVKETLSMDACSPEVSIEPYPGVVVTVPASQMPPDKFVEHIRGLEDTKRDNAFYNPTDCTDAIESLILPLLAQIPSPEAYIYPPTTSPSIPYSMNPYSLSPDNHRTLAESRAIMETLEYCSEELPQTLSSVGGINEEEFVRHWRVSSQLKFAADYQALLHYRIINHYNSTILSIQGDIGALTKFAAVGFDGLTQPLQPVLASLEAHIMPMRWRRFHSEMQPISLSKGLQELTDWHDSIAL